MCMSVSWLWLHAFCSFMIYLLDWMFSCMGISGFFDGLYDGYDFWILWIHSGYMMLWLINFLHLWWFTSIFLRAWPVGCLASYMLMKWIWKYFIGWHGRPIYLLLCFFPAYITVLACLRLFQPASYALGYLACDHLLFFLKSDLIYQEWWKKVYYDQTWWLLMNSHALYEVFSYVITTLNSWISFWTC